MKINLFTQANSTLMTLVAYFQQLHFVVEELIT